ncbi:hypothetical protein BU14_0098s0062 [Porphyra umbilicalis]|uniref:Uncharacterized protein n=1 Tax=Porphyra umbilicalis TaxID=2786 RepID=A0A1X6PDL1_PORUM|nr:hypothetical protein BU14_0098s0062 [Porphyra umbilicalis]|eukprot:OSX78836.1 hypothetical protein BU14_0098s0062 [Porphyra umbilicalis]
MAAFGTAAPGPPHNPNNDVLVSEPPNDGISSLAFSPTALAPKNFLIAGTWDNEVRCYEISNTGTTTPVGLIKHAGPVLDVGWSPDGQTIVSASCDKSAKIWSVATQQSNPVAMHAAAIKSIAYVGDMGGGAPAVITGSWDKTVKYWDPRAPTGQPMGTVNVPERVYAMDVRAPLMVVATADRKLQVYDIRRPTTPFHEKLSLLKYQTRCVATFADGTGYAVGSVEGRVSIDHVTEADRTKDFAFKCHRDPDGPAHAVNAIAFHQTWGTFATAGADGNFTFWDKDAKQRLKQFSKLDTPISATCFNHDGTIFAYAASYEWSKGAAAHNPATARNNILLHSVTETEIRAKPKAVSNNRGGRR